MSAHLRHRILLLDSDRVYCDSLESTLSRSYEIYTMGLGRMALEGLDRHSPDLIILETDLSDMDGMKFAHTLRRNPRHKDVPLVFLSHKDSEVNQRMAYMVGAAMFLSKKTPLERVAINLDVFLRDKMIPVRRKYLAIERVRTDCQEVQPPKASAAPQAPSAVAQQPAVAPKPIAIAATPPASSPAPSSPAVTQPKTQPCPDAKSERMRLLVGESDHKIVFAVQQGLQSCFNCICADSGTDVVEKARRYLPDMLIINIQLAGLSLAEVIESLRISPEFKSMPIIGILKSNDRLQGNMQKTLGVMQVFLVPAEIEQMTYKVRSIINDPAFVQHKYPQTYQQVWAEEEQKRLNFKGLVDAQIGRDNRNREFLEFFKETKMK